MVNNRLRQAFLRGYTQAEGGSDMQPGAQVEETARAATVESQHLRASIDACEQAIAQLGSLPPAEDDQLRAEARASLESLGDTADRLITQLRACLQIIHADDNSPADVASADRSRAVVKKASARGKALARKAATRKTQSKKRSGK